MRDDPDIASVAALIGDPSRAAMLGALVEGRALPAGELAAAAGLSLSGASAQLARLTEGGLLTMEREGRHRYYRLAGPQGASALGGFGAARHEAAPPSCPFAGNRSAAACPHLL
jgi:DNA-binding transcriptional ArsR family regulator